MIHKEIIKALIPNVILQKLQAVRTKKKADRFKNYSTQEIFSEVYQKGLWGKSKDPSQLYYSGSGSHDENITSVYIEKVFEFLDGFCDVPDVVDLGCGDFSIGSKIRQYCNNYVACDIVPQLIEYNRKKHKDLNVDFRILNIITDPLPIAEVVFVRQVFQHLSNEQIQKLIPKLQASYRYLVLTEHLPKSKRFTPNLDKPAGPDTRLGYNSGIVLTAPPFDLVCIDEQLICEVNESDGVIRTMIYKLK